MPQEAAQRNSKKKKKRKKKINKLDFINIENFYLVKSPVKELICDRRGEKFCKLQI